MYLLHMDMPNNGIQYLLNKWLSTEQNNPKKVFSSHRRNKRYYINLIAYPT